MEEFAYSNFDLRFSKSDSGYSCELTDAGGTTCENKFQLPFDDKDIENFLLKIGQQRRRMRKAASPENMAARDFGSKLFAAVFGGAVQSTFAKRLDEVRTAGGGLRMRLHLQKTPDLADLPWEFLYNSDSREFLGLSRDTPIVRYFDLPGTVKPLAISPPLRVLVMLSNPSDVDCLEVEKEWETLKAAVSELQARELVILERLPRATFSELQDRLRKEKYHVFHFVGHGSFDVQNGESGLLMEDEDGRSRFVSGSDLAVFLRDEKTLRLAVLNACEGARASRTDPFSGAAQTLILTGLPAAIAMQFDVSDEAAIAFSRGFYSALADDFPIDAAVAEARKRVYAAVGAAEWGTPVLYLRAADGRIFDVEKTAAQKSAPALEPLAEMPKQPPPLPPPIPPAREPVVGQEREVTTSKHNEKRGPRPWVWLLLGMILMFAAFMSLGAYLSAKKKHEALPTLQTPTPLPATGTPIATAAETPLSFSPPPVPSKYRSAPVNAPANLSKQPLTSASPAPANAAEVAELKSELEKLKKFQAETSNKLNPNAATGKSAQAPPQNGVAAGRSFHLIGWWGVVASPPYTVSRVEFQPNGRFSGVGVDANGYSHPVSGSVNYDAASSTLAANYDDGSWFRARIVKWGAGFYANFSFNGAPVEMYFEAENKSAD